MHIVYDQRNGDYIESESGERVQLYYPFDEQAITKAWEFGLEEAWEAARELFTEEKNGCVSIKSIIKAFNGLCLNDIFRLHTAKEAIKAIKDYEEKKAGKEERIEYLKHEDIKKDGKTVRVWYGGNDSRCAVREKKEKEMKTGDNFIIELGEKTRIQSENSKGEWTVSDECFRIDGTGTVISVKDLMNLKEYKENNDGKENIKHVTPEMFEKVNISTGEGMKKFQEEKRKEQADKKTLAGKKFVIEIEEETEACIFEMKGTNERFFETACKIKGTDAYIAKMDLDKLEEYKKKKDDEEIKVGDEIESSKQIEKAVVLWIEADGYWGCLQNNLFFTVNDKQKKYWKKTGKHYDEVEKIFQKLKESEGEIPFL